MARLPRVQVWPHNCFYLSPAGATGPEAIVYLHGYNDHVRNQLVRAGMRLLSQAQGDFSVKGEDELRIGPPTRETCAWLVEELHRRAEAIRPVWEAQIADIQQELDDNIFEKGEKRIAMQRLRQFRKRLETLDDEIPTEAELMRYFAREQQMRITAGIPPEIRRAVTQVMTEGQWGAIADDFAREASAQVQPYIGEDEASEGKRGRKQPVTAA